MTDVSDLVKDQQVASIDSLAPGDIYKRLEKNYSDTYTFHYGKVLDVVNNGETVAITAVEFTPSYASAERKIKVFGGTNDISLFPVTAQEFRAHLDEAVESANTGVKKASDALVAARNVANELYLLSNEFQRAMAEREVDAESAP